MLDPLRLDPAWATQITRLRVTADLVYQLRVCSEGLIPSLPQHPDDVVDLLARS